MVSFSDFIGESGNETPSTFEGSSRLISSSPMALPPHSQELCFATEAFLDKDFHVDEFVSQCRKRVTIECLREDLEAYFRTLKSAMVELINKDYADFVNLSSNLFGGMEELGVNLQLLTLQKSITQGLAKVGMDRAINNLTVPLGQLREEIMSIKVAMEAAITAIEGKLALKSEIREKKTTLQRLIAILESVERLERLLKIRSGVSSELETSEIEQLAERMEFRSVLLERIASEFNKLQYSVSQTGNHPLVEQIKPRIATITATLQNNLEESFRGSLEKGDRDGLTRCLQTYASINRQEAAESMFQNTVVHPYMEKVISTKSVLLHPQGLAGMYAEVLKFIPKHCSLLLGGATTRQEHGATSTSGGFDFIVNAVWPEVVTLIDERASVIFAPGNPDTFHKNYTASMEFVSSFEALCPSQLSVKHLRSHPSFTTFMSKWSLPVYFQIRFQEIAGALESSLTLPITRAPPNGVAGQTTPPFQLEVFHTLYECLHQCWQKGVFLPALIHRFWKLTLQLVIRMASWLDEVPGLVESSESKKSAGAHSTAVSDFLCVIHDCGVLSHQIPLLFTDVIRQKLPVLALKNPSVLEEGLRESTSKLQQLVPKYATCIVATISQQCIHNLEPAHTIPRLYRRTNREMPQKPSSYVGNILRPLQGFLEELPDQYKKEWSSNIAEAVSERYFEITSEVLTSVKRTEDSLLKLKRNRKSQAPILSSGMSDDNKIRLQLAVDIEEYLSQVTMLGLSTSEVSSLTQLLDVGSSAKSIALAQSSS